jgi:hypothetical protein
MKKNILQYLLCIMMMFALILVSAAFAELKKVDERELALTNASVTGAAVQVQTPKIEKGMILPETDQTDPTFGKGATAFAPAASNAKDGLGLNLNIKGEGTFKLEFGPYHTNTSGGIIRLETH